MDDKFLIEIGTKVVYNGSEATVVDKWLYEGGRYTCEINYDDTGETDIVFLSDLEKVF